MTTDPQEDLVRLAEASAWRVRLTEAGQETSPDFEAWLDGRPGAPEAWRRVQDPWAAIDDLATSPDLLVARRDALERAHRAALTRRPQGWSRRKALGVGAGLAAALGAVSVAGWSLAQPSIYQTDLGERRTIRLKDGSEVALDSGSRLSVRFSRGARSLALIRGQARFNVAHDPTRPFRVQAGGRTVTATGTSFNIDLLGPQVIVTLLQGRVVITADSAQGPTGGGGPVPLEAGYRLVTDTAPGGASSRVEAVSTEKATAWEHGQLVFDDEPLAAVAERVSRYTTRRVVVSEPAVGGLRISGVFTAGDLDTFLDTVTAYLPVRAIPRADGTVDLSHRG